MPYKDKTKEAEVKRRYHLSAAGHVATWNYNHSKKGQRTRHDNQLKRLYNGFGVVEYETMLMQQDGHCKLCPRTPEQNYGKKLHVDHDHTTNRVRGLLCRKCNGGLGALGDNEAGLLKALAYVRGLSWPT